MTGKASTGLGGSLSGGPAATPHPTAVSAAPGRRAVDELSTRAFRAGVAACTLGLAVFCVLRVDARPPHEDETLALFVGRESLPGLLGTVMGQRGGAPLHFLLAWVVAHLGGGVVALRLVSTVCAVAALPVVAALGSRLAGRTVGLLTTAFVAASSVVLNQAVFGRMYALFLLTSTLSYLALLAAVEHGGRRRWALWAVAVLAAIASHPYGVLVLASQGLFVLVLRRRLREAVIAFAAVLLAATPFWISDLVLSRRFDVGVGGGGTALGSPGSVARYLWVVAGDFATRDAAWLMALLCLGLVGLAALLRRRRTAGLLVAAVLVVPVAAFLGARLGSGTSPETRHLIFALPFFSLALAAGVVEVARRSPWTRLGLVALGAVAIVALQVRSTHSGSPALFSSEAHSRVAARNAAAAWLADTSRPDDVLFGYDPMFLAAWEKRSSFSDTVVPRGDGRLATHVLRHAKLGRGIWVLDAGESSNRPPRATIGLHLPVPGSAFEARVFGPFLIVRSRAPTVTPKGYLSLSASVMRLGKSLAITDDDQNLRTIMIAATRLKKGLS